VRCPVIPISFFVANGPAGVVSRQYLQVGKTSVVGAETDRSGRVSDEQLDRTIYSKATKFESKRHSRLFFIMFQTLAVTCRDESWHVVSQATFAVADRPGRVSDEQPDTTMYSKATNKFESKRHSRLFFLMFQALPQTLAVTCCSYVTSLGML
jgi:hypothetical protein